MSYNKIAEWLNKKNYLSARGKILKGNHVHSILKKKRLKDEKLERKNSRLAVRLRQAYGSHKSSILFVFTILFPMPKRGRIRMETTKKRIEKDLCEGLPDRSSPFSFLNFFHTKILEV